MAVGITVGGSGVDDAQRTPEVMEPSVSINVTQWGYTRRSGCRCDFGEHALTQTLWQKDLHLPRKPVRC